ncbi:MAG: hypothetical protein ACRD18_08335 [Terriglobia bacterium]
MRTLQKGRDPEWRRRAGAHDFELMIIGIATQKWVLDAEEVK